jgi:GH24 family phage-related lysozyme (muramidase)
MASNPPTVSKGKALGTSAAIAAAVMVAAPIAQRWEGYSGKMYLDPANIQTQCYGETEDIDPSRIYSKDECAVKLRHRMARDYAPKLMACMPVLGGANWRRYTNVYGALLDASYNAGPASVCAKFSNLVNYGAPPEACNMLPGWYVSARNRKTGVRVVYKGLVDRRKDERSVCLRVAA